MKAIQHEHEDHIKNTLLSQGLVISSILNFSCRKTSSIWSTVQQNMPRNIFNFSIKYLNNTLPTRKNLCKWSIAQSSACSFCLLSETLQHVIFNCKCYLQEGRYTWCHNSVLLYLANIFSYLSQCKIYADLPSIYFSMFDYLTGNNVLYILELTLSFETNMQVNSIRKANKYNRLVKDLSSTYNKITFINCSMGALGVMGSSCGSILSLLQDLNFDNLVLKRIIMKTINIAIRTSSFAKEINHGTTQNF